MKNILNILYAILLLPFELTKFLISKIMGFNEPKFQTIAVIRHEWKILRGVKVVSKEIFGEDGYLYYKVTYDDNSFILFRDL